MTLAVVKARVDIELMPAKIGTIVRTIGMKRPSTTAPGPRRSKKAWDRSRYSVLKKRASGRNSRVPNRAPIQ